jgi:hypothetical protein|tara:strand:- start:203 stop:406 length:204 start_codon:yes stop_codon:yes gene_type:complete
MSIEKDYLELLNSIQQNKVMKLESSFLEMSGGLLIAMAKDETIWEENGMECTRAFETIRKAFKELKA